MLQERNQGGTEGDHLTRGDIHVIHGAHRHIDCLFLADSGKGGLGDEVAVLVKFLVGLGDDVVEITVSGHVLDLVGHVAVDDLAVRGLDEAERVDAAEGCQRTNQTDVRTFRRLDRAHTAKVGRVHVADLHGGAVAGQTAGAQCGETTLVRHTGQRVVLVHELGELGSAEELLDGGVHRTDVDQGLRGDGLGVLSGHTLAYHALHTGQTGTQLVLDQLTDLTDTTVAEVVDIVNVHAQVNIFAVALAREGRSTIVQGHQVLDGGDDVLLVEGTVVEVGLNTQLAVDLVTADAGQIVTLGVEVEGVQQVLAGLGGRGVSRTNLAVEVNKSLVLGLEGFLLECIEHQRVVLEGLGDLGLGHADGHEEHDGGLLALAVHAHLRLVLLIDLELKPCAAGRDNLRAEDFLVGSTVLLTIEVDARGAHELGDDDSLGAADDKGAVRGLQREVAHEHGLGLDLAGVAVLELGVHVQRCGVGVILLLAFLHGVTRLFEVRIGEGQAHGLSEVLDRRDLVEDLIEAGGVGHGVSAVLFVLLDARLPTFVADQPIEAVGLHAQQVGHIDGFLDGTEVHAIRRLVQVNIMLVGACDDGGGVRRRLSSQWTFLIARLD